MGVCIEIIQGPLEPSQPTSASTGAGAALVFEGIVRGEEEGREITGLRYEAYQPMARRMLERIAEELLLAHHLIHIEVSHSEGFVPVGQCSLRVRIESTHRAEALSAMEALIDRLKQDVPIWKHVVAGE